MQEQAASLLGIWADDGDFVLELGGTGVYTLAYGSRQPGTGTWSLQENGSLVLEGQSYVAIPHGNLLLFDADSLDATLHILHKVGEDGSLLAYEPSNAVAVPAIEVSEILAMGTRL